MEIEDFPIDIFLNQLHSLGNINWKKAERALRRIFNARDDAEYPKPHKPYLKKYASLRMDFLRKRTRYKENIPERKQNRIRRDKRKWSHRIRY